MDGSWLTEPLVLKRLFCKREGREKKEVEDRDEKKILHNWLGMSILVRYAVASVGLLANDRPTGRP
jgi:hypothetical protein